MTMPQPQFGQPGSARPNDQPSVVARLMVVSLLTVFVVGYALAVFLTRDIWLNAREGTRLTFTAQTSDGSAPPVGTVTETANVVRERLRGHGATVAVQGGDVVVTVPGRNVKPDALSGVIKTGRLSIRPVIQLVPAQPQIAPLPPKPADPSVIEFEKQIRQTTDPTMQLLALQVQATRCHDPDPLAGSDDPNLPLITCGGDSVGGAAAYLLDQSILSGTDIAKASWGLDKQRGVYVVSMEFTPKAAKVWADFTSRHWQQGTQTAFIVDTQVISAPAIREPIVRGKVEITGHFTQQSARELAEILGSGSLPVPLIFTSSSDATLEAATMSKVLRVAIIGLGVGITAIVVAAMIYLVRRAPDHVSP